MKLSPIRMATFVDLLENALLDEGLEVEIRTHYSGRMMYDRTCLAIVTDDPYRVIAKLGALSYEDEEFEVFDPDHSSARSDSMGRRTVLYWPNISEGEEEA